MDVSNLPGAGATGTDEETYVCRGSEPSADARSNRIGMSESSRRIHAASRQATKAIATLKGLGYTEDDVVWTETRTIALMLEGVPFIEAVEQASKECAVRLFERRVAALQTYEEMRQRQREEGRTQRDAEEAERRSKLEARATLGQRPSLKTSLGDLIAAKRR